MPLLGGHLKGGLKAHELTRRSSPYDIMAILIFASPEGAGQRASDIFNGGRSISSLAKEDIFSEG